MQESWNISSVNNLKFFSELENLGARINKNYVHEKCKSRLNSGNPS
jgi:hypothetical protein